MVGRKERRLMSLVKVVLKLWATKDPLPETADLIVALSMGAVEGRLSNGTRAFFKKAIEVKASYPGAKLVFVSFDLTKVGEVRIKKQIAPDAIFAGPAMDSIDEATLTKGLREKPRSVIVVTGECHSRRAKLIWGKVFPETKISIVSISAEKEIDQENVLGLLRRVDVCLATNIAGYLFVRLLGIRFSKVLKIKQPGI
jgi:hypothetical protein